MILSLAKDGTYQDEALRSRGNWTMKSVSGQPVLIVSADDGAAGGYVLTYLNDNVIRLSGMHWPIVPPTAGISTQIIELEPDIRVRIQPNGSPGTEDMELLRKLSAQP